MRGQKEVESINSSHKNLKYLMEYELPINLDASSDPAEALKDIDVIIHAIPVQASQDFLKSMATLIPANVPIISLSKGIHCDTLQFMFDIINDSLNRKQPSAFLSGPSFARELMDGQPTGLVIASEDEQLATRLGQLFQSDRTKVYTSTDVIGVEVGGALKNVYAIAAGIAEGLGYKLNTAALLVTRGCAEMKKLAIQRGAKEHTLAGLSGIGDLMLTCFGGASRNRSVGVRLGKGEKIDDILNSMSEVAEGVPTVGAVVKLADRYKLELPLARAVAAVLAGNVDIKQRIDNLMRLPVRPEDV